MELNGVRSNPRAGVELSRLGALHGELLRKAQASPREPRRVPTKVNPVLNTVIRVLEEAGTPLRVRAIHAAACDLAGELRWELVRSALSADVKSEHPRFERVGHGRLRGSAPAHGCHDRDWRMRIARAFTKALASQFRALTMLRYHERGIVRKTVHVAAA